jgi:hypothetical protein
MVLVSSHHCWLRVFNGRRTWGSLDVSPSRYGLTRHRLVVFPPSLSRDERRLLRLWRSWPIWATMTWLVLEMLLIPAIGSGSALAISTGVSLGAGAVLMAMTSATRTRVRTLSVMRMAGFDDKIAAERCTELYALAEVLAAADRKLTEGEFSTVDHEAVVWRVYDSMPLAAAAQF